MKMPDHFLVEDQFMDAKVLKLSVKQERVQGKIAISQRLKSFSFTAYKIGEIPIRISAFLDEKQIAEVVLINAQKAKVPVDLPGPQSC